MIMERYAGCGGFVRVSVEKRSNAHWTRTGLIPRFGKLQTLHLLRPRRHRWFPMNHCGKPPRAQHCSLDHPPASKETWLQTLLQNKIGQISVNVRVLLWNRTLIIYKPYMNINFYTVYNVVNKKPFLV